MSPPNCSLCKCGQVSFLTLPQSLNPWKIQGNVHLCPASCLNLSHLCSDWLVTPGLIWKRLRGRVQDVFIQWHSAFILNEGYLYPQAQPYGLCPCALGASQCISRDIDKILLVEQVPLQLLAWHKLAASRPKEMPFFPQCVPDAF